MKIHHVLLYKFKPGIDRIDEHLATILRFRDNTEGLLDVKCGRNIVQGYADRFTHGFIMIFASHADLDRYARSEPHRLLADGFRADLEDKFIFDFYSP